MTKIRNRQPGFSLTEMLIATGIMAVGLVMIATIFPVGVKLTGMSAERSVAAVAADEAFAKIALYGMRDFTNWPTTEPNAVCTDYIYTTSYAGPDGIFYTSDDNYMGRGPDNNWGTADDIYWDTEFKYPSTVLPAGETHKYHWSALCRQAGDKDVQVTVFVTSRTVGGLKYYELPWDGSDFAPSQSGPWPKPVSVDVQYDPSSGPRTLVIRENSSQTYNWDAASGLSQTAMRFFDDGYTIVNGRDGRIYRVFEMKDYLPVSSPDGKRETIVLYDDWQWDGYDDDPLNPPASAQTETIWVVPPGVGSSRYPCVGVFQKIMHFDEIN